MPAAASLLAVGGWLPAPYIAPALVAAGGTIAAVDVSIMGPPAALTLVALQAVGLGLAGGDAVLSVATLIIGLAVALGRLLSLADTPRAATERRIVSGLVAAVWCGLAFLWARAAHLVSAELDAAWAWNGVAALPFALAPFALVTRGGTRGLGVRPAALAAGGGIVLGALGLALASFPTLGLPSVVTGMGAAALVTLWARRADRAAGALPSIAAQASGLLAVWITARAPSRRRSPWRPRRAPRCRCYCRARAPTASSARSRFRS